jgi:type II secretory pathway pseudopilin PulG
LTVHGALTLLVVAVLLVLVVGGAQALGVFQTWRVRLQAQADLAKAERAAQEADRLAALEALERARGDRELHEAAAASIRKDARLVTWYAVRGDVLALALGVPFMVAAGAIVGTVIGRRLAKARNDPDEADAGGAA